MSSNSKNPYSTKVYKTLEDTNLYQDTKLIGKLPKGTSVTVLQKPFNVLTEDGYTIDAYELRMPNYIDTYIYGYNIGLGTKPVSDISMSATQQNTTTETFYTKHKNKIIIISGVVVGLAILFSILKQTKVI